MPAHIFAQRALDSQKQFLAAPPLHTPLSLDFAISAGTWHALPCDADQCSSSAFDFKANAPSQFLTVLPWKAFDFQEKLLRSTLYLQCSRCFRETCIPRGSFAALGLTPFPFAPAYFHLRVLACGFQGKLVGALFFESQQPQGPFFPGELLNSRRNFPAASPMRVFFSQSCLLPRPMFLEHLRFQFESSFSVSRCSSLESV